MNNTELMKIGEISKQLGTEPQRLRRYCNANLVPGLRPVALGRHRAFTPEQVDYLRMAIFLSRAGFTTKDLRKYVRLTQDSRPEATEERLAMLKTHKRQVWQELEDLQATIDFLERQEELLGEKDLHNE